MSWWDVYGPAACIVAFAIGFAAAMILMMKTYMRDYRERLDDMREDSDHWRRRALRAEASQR
jgi:hypothetical protein